MMIKANRAMKPETMHQRLQRAYLVAAEIVAQHGEKYLPIFERLESELRAINAKESAIDRARMVASKARQLQIS